MSSVEAIVESDVNGRLEDVSPGIVDGCSDVAAVDCCSDDGVEDGGDDNDTEDVKKSSEEMDVNNVDDGSKVDWILLEDNVAVVGVSEEEYMCSLGMELVASVIRDVAVITDGVCIRWLKLEDRETTGLDSNTLDDVDTMVECSLDGITTGDVTDWVTESVPILSVTESVTDDRGTGVDCEIVSVTECDMSGVGDLNVTSSLVSELTEGLMTDVVDMGVTAEGVPSLSREEVDTVSMAVGCVIEAGVIDSIWVVLIVDRTSVSVVVTLADISSVCVGV